MCSPLGNATMNSLMNVATFLLEITSHSHSFTPSTDSSNLDAHITLHFHLATQTPMILHLFAAEMRNFRRQNLATAIQYLAFALSARTLTTTSGRKEYTVHRQRIQQRGKSGPESNGLYRLSGSTPTGESFRSFSFAMV